LERLELRPGGA